MAESARSVTTPACRVRTCVRMPFFCRWWSEAGACDPADHAVGDDGDHRVHVADVDDRHELLPAVVLAVDAPALLVLQFGEPG